jgi:hypothetical protein
MFLGASVARTGSLLVEDEEGLDKAGTHGWADQDVGGRLGPTG